MFGWVRRTTESARRSALPARQGDFKPPVKELFALLFIFSIVDRTNICNKKIIHNG